MDILQYFKKPQATGSNIINLSSEQAKRVKSTTIDLDIKAKNLTKKDIGTWRQAWQMAVIPDNPRRYTLYGVYDDVIIDNHLSGCIDQRKNCVLQKSFKIVDKEGKEKPELTEIFEVEWFKDFLSLCLDSIFWGHSLIEFGDIIGEGNKRRFDHVKLVPRSHVIPEYGIILKDPTDDLKRGFSYKEGVLAQWCMEAGKSHDLGLLLKVSPNALSKKNMLAFWDNFGEIFGMPIRIANVSTRDEKEVKKVEKMMDKLAASAWGVFPTDTEIKFVESSRGDAFNVYDQRIARANNEISKTILNQTMTIDDGSSLSQSQTHLDIFNRVVSKDADFLRDLINFKLLPFMTLKGFALENIRFNWDESIDYTAKEQYDIENLLLQNYEIEPAYFAEKYNIPIIGKKEATFNHKNDFFA